MNSVYLHGHLADMFGPVWRFEVRSPAEALRAIEANCRGFLAYLRRNSEPGYHVVVGSLDNTDRSVDELHAGVGDQDIHIVPEVVGASGRQGWTQVILGAVLVVVGAVGMFTPYGQALGGATWGQYLMGSGISMMLGGVVQLLTRPPSFGNPEESAENKPSYIFNGPINTQAQGHPVPVGYGMLRVGGACVSTSIVVEDFTPGVDDPGVGFRITNYPTYDEVFDSTPATLSYQLNAAGGTAPYSFTITTQAPAGVFAVSVDGGKSYLETTTADYGRHVVEIECTDDGEETVSKTLTITISSPGGGSLEPTL